MRDPVVYRSARPDVLAHWDRTAEAAQQDESRQPTRLPRKDTA